MQQFNRNEFKKMEEAAKKNTYDAYLKSQNSGNSHGEFAKPQDLYKDYPDGGNKNVFDNKKPHDDNHRGNNFNAPEPEKPKNSILNLINIKGLDLDGDTAIIALLILLLSKDAADELLLMALVYVML